MQWLVTPSLHVIPLGDLREHEVTENCWCKPTVDDLNVCKHNSLDQREKYESGELRLH